MEDIDRQGSVVTYTQDAFQVLTVLCLEKILFGKNAGDPVPIVPAIFFPEFKLIVAFRPELFSLFVRLDLGKVAAPFEIGVVDEYAGIAVGLPGGQLVVRAEERRLVGNTVVDKSHCCHLAVYDALVVQSHQA